MALQVSTGPHSHRFQLLAYNAQQPVKNNVICNSNSLKLFYILKIEELEKELIFFHQKDLLMFLEEVAGKLFSCMSKNHFLVKGHAQE